MIAVHAIGAVTAAGDDAPNTMASIISQLQLFDDIDVRGATGEPLTGATTGIPKRVRGLQRLSALGLVATTECAAKAPPRLALPLVICAPKDADLDGDQAQLLAGVASDATINVDRRRSRVFSGGRSAIGPALRHAAEILTGGSAPACYLVGVDSLTDRKRAARLREQRRLFEPGNEEGFIPGEAGVCLLLSARPDKTSLGWIAGVGEGRDIEQPATVGAGLADAMNGAVQRARVDANTLRAFIHDSSGSRREADELTLASQRAPFNRMEHPRIYAPADYTGDIGAASGVLSLAMASFFISEGVDGLDRGAALVACLSERVERTAAVLTAPR